MRQISARSSRRPWSPCRRASTWCSSISIRQGVLDPQGIHNLIWAELGQELVVLPSNKPLQVVSYLAHGKISSFIEPLTIRDALPEAPLFLDDGRFVRLPLEATYMTSFEALPDHLRQEIAGN